jgi:hypothetical protein
MHRHVETTLLGSTAGWPHGGRVESQWRDLRQEPVVRSAVLATLRSLAGAPRAHRGHFLRVCWRADFVCALWYPGVSRSRRRIGNVIRALYQPATLRNSDASAQCGHERIQTAHRRVRRAASRADSTGDRLSGGARGGSVVPERPAGRTPPARSNRARLLHSVHTDRNRPSHSRSSSELAGRVSPLAMSALRAQRAIDTIGPPSRRTHMELGRPEDRLQASPKRRVDGATVLNGSGLWRADPC